MSIKTRYGARFLLATAGLLGLATAKMLTATPTNIPNSLCLVADCSTVWFVEGPVDIHGNPLPSGTFCLISAWSTDFCNATPDATCPAKMSNIGDCSGTYDDGTNVYRCYQLITKCL